VLFLPKQFDETQALILIPNGLSHPRENDFMDVLWFCHSLGDDKNLKAAWRCIAGTSIAAILYVRKTHPSLHFRFFKPA
jgi:hypothetical protein